MISAQTWALTKLTKMHGLRYRELYLLQKKKLIEEGCIFPINHLGATAAGKAKTLLCNEFIEDYRKLYSEAKELGYLGSIRKKRNASV